MTRQELKDLMPDITDEQISAVLAKHHEEINAKTKAAEDKFSAYKDKADKYDKEQADKLSEQEKYQKLMEEATQIKAENTSRQESRRSAIPRCWTALCPTMRESRLHSLTAS